MKKIICDICGAETTKQGKIKNGVAVCKLLIYKSNTGPDIYLDVCEKCGEAVSQLFRNLRQKRGKA